MQENRIIPVAILSITILFLFITYACIKKEEYKADNYFTEHLSGKIITASHALDMYEINVVTKEIKPKRYSSDPIEFIKIERTVVAKAKSKDDIYEVDDYVFLEKRTEVSKSYDRNIYYVILGRADSCQN